jgi:dinuclear metal center YbgI/SA1388 family protein
MVRLFNFLSGCRKTPICCVIVIPRHCDVLSGTPHSAGFREPWIWTFSGSLSEAGFLIDSEMIPKLKDILDLLEEIAPLRLAEEWDNPGLQVGIHSQEVGKVFVSLDPTLQALKKAVKAEAQLLLTHHPLIFQPLSHLDGDLYPGNVIFEALRHGVAIVAAHTNLDVARGGINDMLADLFHLSDVEVLQPVEGNSGRDIGLGRIGNIPEPMSLSDMIERVKSVLGSKGLRMVGSKARKIRRVALVGGSGGSLVATASKKGADLLITGDVGHHDALEAESRGLALIDGGHFYTEKEALALFARQLKGLMEKRGWRVEVVSHHDEKNPFQYGS